MSPAEQSLPCNISGVVPSLSVQADLGPPRSEGAVGALMPWAGRLWMVSFVAHKSRTGSGTGLYEIDGNLRMRKHPASVVGTYANRMVHHETNQLVIGPHVIDADGSVRTVRELVDIRVTATMRHLREPKRMVYMLGMEGELFELDLETLACRQIADLAKELRLPEGAQPHFKGAFATGDRVFVTNNTYDERDFLGTRRAGRLAEWGGATGPGAWNIVEERSFYEVHGRLRLGGVVYAAGWDAASAILMVRVGPGDGYVPEAQKAGLPAGAPAWRRFRLPKASANY